MSDDSRSLWERLDDPRVTGLVGLLFVLAVVLVLLAGRPYGLLYPLALVAAGLLLARRARGSPIALAGCAGLSLGGVLEALAVTGVAGTALAAELLALLGFLVFLVGR